MELTLKKNSWKRVRYFVPNEFDDPNYLDSGKNIDGALLYKLDELRHETGWPIVTHWEVGGCVDVGGTHGHSENSYHLITNGAKACDFHFLTNIDPRLQYREVEKIGFFGIGIYYDWHWDDKLLPIGFHVDERPKNKLQRWTRRNGQYFYLLGR